GLEPAAFWATARRSNQLSYGHREKILSISLLDGQGLDNPGLLTYISSVAVTNFSIGGFMKSATRISAILLVFSYLPSIVRSETGVTDKEIVIASCSALTGPSNKLGLNQIMGATAYLNEINEKGGVHGRKIKLLELDDKYEPDGAIECFKKLQDAGPFAGAFFVGTPTGAKHAPMAEAAKI